MLQRAEGSQRIERIPFQSQFDPSAQLPIKKLGGYFDRTKDRESMKIVFQDISQQNFRKVNAVCNPDGLTLLKTLKKMRPEVQHYVESLEKKAGYV